LTWKDAQGLPTPQWTLLAMSGLELLPKAKALRPDVPIIMITAYGDVETKRQALEKGAEALLTKPIDFGMLRSMIDTRVERPA
jgi:DNA-binding response OmpR family regulator